MKSELHELINIFHQFLKAGFVLFTCGQKFGLIYT